MRQLCWIGLAAACAFAQESLVVDSNLRGALDRHLTGIAEQLWTSRAREVARIKTPEQVAARQRYIRERILSSFGGFPEKTPLNAKITGTLERDGYRVEKLVYESLPGFFVTANVYVPAKATGPFPALLGVAGHSDTGKAAPFYQAPWISMARRGVLVLAYDPPGQG